MSGQLRVDALAGKPILLRTVLRPAPPSSMTIRTRAPLRSDGKVQLPDPATGTPTVAQHPLFLRPSSALPALGGEVREPTAILLGGSVVHGVVTYTTMRQRPCGALKCLIYRARFTSTASPSTPARGASISLTLVSTVAFAPSLRRFLEVRLQLEAKRAGAAGKTRGMRQHLRFSRVELLQPPDLAQRRAVAALRVAGASIMLTARGEARSVRLKHGAACDELFVHMAKLVDLTNVNCGGRGASDAGVKLLRGLTKLRWIQLNSANLTDAGVAVLADLPELTFVNLTGTHVSDAGLRSLAKLTKLTSLALNGTCVTNGGVAALRTARPKLQIVWNTRPANRAPRATKCRVLSAP